MGKKSAVAGLRKDAKEWLDRALVENNFSEYEALAAELKARGYDISKSSVHRYGQDFEKRLATLKLASEQAKAIVETAPDDEGAVSEALMRLVQEKLFQVMLDFQVDPDKPLNIASAAKAVAELSRATVNQKKWQAEVRVAAREELLREQAAELDKTVQSGGMDEDQAMFWRKKFLGVS